MVFVFRAWGSTGKQSPLYHRLGIFWWVLGSGVVAGMEVGVVIEIEELAVEAGVVGNIVRVSIWASGCLKP